VGLGYGTDTDIRLRGQYRRAIVNKRGHSFDANIELSGIRQSIDGRYNIPYHHPLNDYVSIVGGYEREEREGVAQGEGLLIESAVLGADRIIKNPLGNWQRTFGARYRLDRLTQDGSVDFNQIPEAFRFNTEDEQQSLLVGYEVSRTESDRRVNPTKGFKQTYKIELGSEALLSDADMAIVNAGWRFIYSLGENADHQFVGRADAGYIFTEDFAKVPYNLRYFTGGDQSIRGFDYKSLSPEIDGFKVGGQALGVASLEYNYQFKEGWRAAVFADAGNAYNKEFSNPTEYGAGVGVRWASPIGPIRIDVATGLSDDNYPIRLHFFIGSQL
jgi:translocation and assembly module TamA